MTELHGGGIVDPLRHILVSILPGVAATWKNGPRKLSNRSLAHRQASMRRRRSWSGGTTGGLTSAGAAVVELIPDLAVALGRGLQILARELARLLPQLLRHRRLLCSRRRETGRSKRRRGLGFGNPFSFSATSCIF
jgi:hypothetical protein